MLKAIITTMIASMLFVFPIVFCLSQTVVGGDGNSDVVNEQLVAEDNTITDGDVAQISVVETGAPVADGNSGGNGGSGSNGGSDDNGGNSNGGSGDNSGGTSDNSGGTSDNSGGSGSNSGGSGDNSGGSSTDNSGGNSGGSSSGSNSDTSGGNSGANSGGNGGSGSNGGSSGNNNGGSNGGSNGNNNGGSSGNNNGGSNSGSGGDSQSNSGGSSGGSSSDAASSTSSQLYDNLAKPVIINKICPYTETSSEYGNGEVELYNKGKAPVDMNQWYLENLTGYIIATINNKEIAPSGVLAVRVTGLTSDYQKITLFDSSGKKIDSAMYSGARFHSGLSFARIPNSGNLWRWTK